MDQYHDATKKLSDQLLQVNQYKLDIWKEYVLFGWHWWLGVFVCLVSITLWIKYHNKNLKVKLLLAGLTAAILSAFLDTTYLFFGMFDYLYEVLPMASNYIPWNFFIIPVLIMFSIQLFPTINAYLKGIVLSLLVSFIGLPLLKFIGIFEIYNWQYVYSFVSMFVIFVLSYQMSKIAKDT
ncbi:CBO0543 family protein [Virgibacillus oceani]|uniref:Uncharacterized protein n=1 Tax=Virgibacillus oceani TaxID=1479511 RepID=A0A917HHI7_9BACI|nr:CBO0543 family protein [Virgibacillus oceani]GGG78775.1 hypothetical protein GCM10011398_25100 [Virgibacillus oceani]